MNPANTIEVVSPIVVSLEVLPEYLRLNNAHAHNKKCSLSHDNLKLCIVCLEPRESFYYDDSSESDDEPDDVEPFDCPRCDQFYCAPCRVQFESLDNDCPTCKFEVIPPVGDEPVPVNYIDDSNDYAGACDCELAGKSRVNNGIIMLRPKLIDTNSDQFKDCLQSSARFNHYRQWHADWWGYRHDSEFCIVCHEYLFTDTPDIDCAMCPCSLSYCIRCITKLGSNPDDLEDSDQCPACEIGVKSIQYRRNGN
jgi:hypothetical protein